MRSEDVIAVREALEQLRKNEPFEKALGRVLRKKGNTFEDYIRIVGEIRELARKKKISSKDAGQLIVDELEKQKKGEQYHGDR
ncbi:MAG: hypothetical protein QHH00_06560 [Methanomassiliicoccales archaeon]|jgi:hypothetical protein|nr:hypothetical protein [Methanomassiliicoccales archaeon]